MSAPMLQVKGSPRRACSSRPALTAWGAFPPETERERSSNSADRARAWEVTVLSTTEAVAGAQS